MVLRVRACCETENLKYGNRNRTNGSQRQCLLPHNFTSRFICIHTPFSDSIYSIFLLVVRCSIVRWRRLSFSRKMVWNWNFHNGHSSTFRSEQLFNIAIFHLFLFLLCSGAVVSSESMSEQSLSGRARYGSTSSLSSVATASSPCTAGIPVSIHRVATTRAQPLEH